MSLVKNSMWNILAVVLPTAIAIPSLGIIARSLGVELFGIFTLIFALVGYANIFDIGLSRAVVRAISLERGSINKIKKILFTASSVVLFVGSTASLLLYVFSFKLVILLNISIAYQKEVVFCFELMSFVIPVFLLNLVWLSYLEGLERFKELSIIRIMGNTLLSLLPLIGILISPNISSAVIGLLSARFITLLISVFYSKKELEHVSVPVFNYHVFRSLIHFGSWITVSNIISPIMTYFDRFILSSISGASHVALYTAPAEVVSKMLAVPMAITKALFPRMVVTNNGYKLKNRSLLTIFVLAIFMMLPLFIFAEWFLLLWLGDGFTGAATALRILLVGFVFNAMAQVSYTDIQAKGYSKLTAKIHLFELVPYLCVLFFFIEQYSIVGAALAWSLRVSVDFIVLECFSRKISLNKCPI